MTNNSNHGRTLWDLIAYYPIKSFLLLIAFLIALFFFTQYIITTLIEKNYSYNSPFGSFQPSSPPIIQDTSRKSKLDTSYKINETSTSKKNDSRRQIVIKAPNKDTIKSQVVNVTSNNQFGGITANQVNIGAVPRKIDLTLTNQLLVFAQNKDESIDITSVMGDQEAYQFATEIKNFLLSQGYKKVDGVNQALFNQPVIGQFLNRENSGIKILIGSKGTK